MESWSICHCSDVATHKPLVAAQTPHLPTQRELLLRHVYISHLLPGSTRCLPLLLLSTPGHPEGVVAGVRGAQQVLKMPVGVDGESGVVALLDYGNNGLGA